MGEANPNAKESGSILAVVTQPLTAYFSAWKGFWKEDYTAHLLSLNIKSREIIELIVAAGIISTIISKLTAYGSGGAEFTGLPIIDELIYIVFAMIGSIIAASLIYKPLIWAGGKGQFRQAVIGAIYASALAAPIVTVFGAVYFNIYRSEIPVSYGSYASTGLYYMLLSKIYGLSINRVAAVAALTSLGFVFVIICMAAILTSAPKTQYGTTCQTYLGSCPSGHQPVGSACYCMNPYTFQSDMGRVK